MSILDDNREAWDRQVESGNRWTVPVTRDEIASARRGRWSVLLTPHTAVPRAWFPPLDDLRVLCLAGGGGQQGPILAAAGARVTVLDASPRQLEQDRVVAERDGLELATIEGDMADLSCLEDASFDLVFNPVSNCFAPAVGPIWRESFRVLRPGGSLLAGFANPVLYLFDDDVEATAELRVTNRIPYSDAESLDQEERREHAAEGWPLEFGHTLTDQIGGQLEAGFVLLGLYEDEHHREEHPLRGHIATFIATRAWKPTGTPE